MSASKTCRQRLVGTKAEDGAASYYSQRFAEGKAAVVEKQLTEWQLEDDEMKEYSTSSSCCLSLSTAGREEAGGCKEKGGGGTQAKRKGDRGRRR